MPRKKSATKKAKEAELKSKQGSEVSKLAESKAENEQNVADTKIEPPALKPLSDDDDDDLDSSSSEEEDEYGELLTDNIDSGINNVLQALKTDPSKLLDKDVKFFDDNEQQIDSKGKKEKPMYLKDYHRLNLLSGGYNEDDDTLGNEYGTVDGEKPFVVTEREERDQLLSDIKSAFNDGDDNNEEDEDFLKKKEKANSGEEEKLQLPDPEKNQEEFLQSFLNSKAWIPTKHDKVIDLDRTGEDDEDFDNAAENFENAYNFRYEDPNSAEIVSYARNQATLRRDKTNARKRQRERQQQEKEEELKKREEKIKKREMAKINKAVDRMAQIKEAVGSNVSEEVIQKVFGDSLLNDDFDDADWDNKMAEIFNEQYYDEEGTKPEWSDMEDMKNNDDNDDHDEEDIDEDTETKDYEAVESDQEPPKKKSKKEKLQEKKSSKKEKQAIKEAAKRLVESNRPKLIEEVEEEEERGRSKDADIKFKYREISPETFGLTTRDILVADDKQLNSYIGLKKFAPYRPKELRVKDRRKYKKKKPLEEWRKDALKSYKPKEDDDENAIWIEANQTKNTDKKKHKHKHKS